MTQKQAKSSVNARVLLLKSTLKLGQNEFCQACRISTATYQDIRDNKSTVRERTYRNIAEKLRANPDWIFTGEGEMFIKETKNELSDGPSITQKMYDKLSEQLDKQNKVVQQLTQVIMNLTGPKNGEAVSSFLNTVKKAGFLSIVQKDEELLAVA